MLYHPQSFADYFLNGSLPSGSITYSDANWSMVGVSYAIAVLASYLAILILRRTDTTRNKLFSVIMGAITFGTGVWSMHFTGMLAVKTSMVHEYDLWTTITSWGIGVGVAFSVFYSLAFKRMTWRRVLGVSPFLGLGIAAMHYTGMAAMRMDAVMVFQTHLFILSVMIAIAASGAAMVLMKHAAATEGAAKGWTHLGVAVVMGLAVAGMHYTGMMATVFLPFANCRFDPNQSHMEIVLLVTSCTMLVMGVSTLLVMWLRLEAAASTGRMKWYYVYYVLAGFNIFTVGLGVYMNQRLMDMHSQSNVVRADMLGMLDTLLSVSKAINSTIVLLDRSHEVTVDPNQLIARVEKAANNFDRLENNLPMLLKYNENVGNATTQEAITTIKRTIENQRQQLKHLQHHIGDAAKDDVLSPARIKLGHGHTHTKEIHSGFDEEFHVHLHEVVAGMMASVSDISSKVTKLEQALTLQGQAQMSDLSELNRIVYITMLLLVVLATASGVRVAKRIRETQQDNERLLLRAQESEAQLAESHKFLNKVIDSVADPIFVKNRRHQWVVTNAAFCEMLGYTSEQLIGKSDFDLFPKEQADVFWEMDEKVFSSGAIIVNEEKIRHESGEDRTILTKKVPITLSDGNVGIVGIFHDVTEDALLRDELRRHRDNLQQMVDEQTKDLIEAKDRAESANIAKSEFLSNMSHELRTPIHAIKSFAQLCMDITNEADSQQARRKLTQFIQNITVSADRLNLLVSDLLDMSKLESGKLDYQFEANNILKLVEQSFDQLQGLMFDKRLRYDVSSDEGISLVDVDYRSMMQVIINVLSNAIKFSPEGGMLECHIGYDGDHVLISLRDQGPGIPESELELIFDKFVQSTKTKTKAGGTGLGLSICRQIVEDHSGRIWFENNQDSAGATVFIRLPLHQSLAQI